MSDEEKRICECSKWMEVPIDILNENEKLKEIIAKQQKELDTLKQRINSNIKELTEFKKEMSEVKDEAYCEIVKQIRLLKSLLEE